MKIPAFILSFKPHPFRLLLVLEWILLGVTVLKSISLHAFNLPILGQSQSLSELGLPNGNNLQPIHFFGVMGLLIVFALLGFRLPADRLSKICYLSFSFLIIGAIAYIQGGAYVETLFMILVLRGCLILERHGRWLIASLIWLSYAVSTLFGMVMIWGMFQTNTLKTVDLSMIPGLIVQSDGGIQWTVNLSPSQVSQLMTFIRQGIINFSLETLVTSGLIIIFILLLVDSLVNERQGRKKLTIAHQQLYQYSLQIEDQATLQERTRIAREIHDSLGHLLTAQSVMLENTTMSPDGSEEARSFLDESQRLGREARRELRQAVWMLRSDPMQGKSLPKAIDDLVQEFHQVTGIHPVVTLDQRLTFPGRYQVALYRILEEAFTNIQKHSQATEVTIDLNLKTKEDKIPQIVLKVIDNGTGFDPQQTRSGFGLQGMRERVESLAGTLEFKTQSGCTIIVHIPLLEVSL